MGKHNATFTAPYNGKFQSVASVTGVGVKAGTTTSIGATPNPSALGQAVTLTAVVTSQTTGTPTGNVTFKAGGSVLGAVALNGGTAKLTTSKLTGGVNTITAAYAGSNLYAAGTGTVTETVKPAVTITTLASSLNPSSFGQTVTFTASVSSKVAGTISGNVTFSDGSTVLGTAAVSAGKATFSTTKLNAGTHSISAQYKGSRNFAVSTSKAVSQKVNQVKTTTNLKSSANPATHGTVVTFTATVTPAIAGNPTGSVTFKDGATVLGTPSLNASTHQAQITKSNLAVGTHTITAVYSGAGNFVTSTSGSVAQVIK